MKTFVYRTYHLVALLFLALLFSCEREVVTDIVNNTPPTLQVTVKTAAAEPLSGAAVQLYNTEASWNAETNPVATQQTGTEGFVIFEKAVLLEPGFYYLVASDGTKKAKLKTPYLLLTDGKTLVEVKLP